MAIKITENVPLVHLTTFQIGGSARYFTEVRTDDEAREAVSWAHDNDIIFLCLPAEVMCLFLMRGYRGL